MACVSTFVLACRPSFYNRHSLDLEGLDYPILFTVYVYTCIGGCIVRTLFYPTLTLPVDDCGPPPAIPGGTVDSTETVYLSEANYSCESGFRVQPPASSLRVCEVGGVWSGDNGTCQREFVYLSLY